MSATDPAMTEGQFRKLLADFAKSAQGEIDRLESMVLNLSLALAEKEHGTEAVRAAAKAAGDRLGSFVAEHHPYEALMQWFKENGSH